MTISLDRQKTLLGYCLLYAHDHNLTPPVGANPAAGVDTEADRDLIRQVQGHAHGYHGADVPVDGTFNTATQKLLDAAYAPKPAPVALVRPLATTLTPQSEYAYPDAEGAPQHRDGSGTRRHGGKDWFAPGGTPVSSPETGVIVESHDSGDRSGQVFGGTVRVQTPKGRVWVFRHVANPAPTGTRVTAGQRIAVVSPWDGGATHTHIELWKSWAYGTAGYFLDNMVDPLPVLQQAAPA